MQCRPWACTALNRAAAALQLDKRDLLPTTPRPLAGAALPQGVTGKALSPTQESRYLIALSRHLGGTTELDRGANCVVGEECFVATGYDTMCTGSLNCRSRVKRLND